MNRQLNGLKPWDIQPDDLIETGFGWKRVIRVNEMPYLDINNQRLFEIEYDFSAVARVYLHGYESRKYSVIRALKEIA